jgi:hypothetical protein
MNGLSMSHQTCRVVALAFVLLAALAPAAAAQGPYVSASLTGDIVRLNRIETRGSGESGDGEALGFALRLGTEIGSRWGVEAEVARPSAIESSFAPGVFPLTLAGSTSVSVPPSGVVSPGIVELIPYPYPYTYRVETRQRNTMLSVAAWARQELSPRISLAYLGGIGFHRTTQDAEISFEPGIQLGRPTIFPAPSLTESVVYTVGPFAGVEARIGLADHVQLIPGVRLHGISGGWLVRSSIGLGWVF